MAEPKPAGRAIQDSGAPTERSASKPRKRGGRRGRRAQLLGRLNALSRERQEAWAAEHRLTLDEFRRAVETGHRDLTGILTTKLERGFEDLRQADRDRHEASEPEGHDFRHPSPEMRTDNGKPRATKKPDWIDFQITENEITISTMGEGSRNG